ncbi:MAG TPA: ATP-dependent DNA helicase RecG [Candidatus Omnitrophica bacterium]|nr:ATP-dependent DNA helicase RecG [Candidatus Omnitrophota bacterium]
MFRDLHTPIRYLKGVGVKRANSFAKIGIGNIEDLLFYFPKRYEDRSSFSNLSSLSTGNIYTIRARVLSVSGKDSWRRRNFKIINVTFANATGKIYAVWFNQPYLRNYFKPGVEVILYGKVEIYQGHLQMHNPEFELLGEDNDGLLSLGKMVPVYRLPERITQRYFRKIVNSLLDEFIPSLRDGLPYDIRKRNDLLNLAKSIRFIHFPQDKILHSAAYRRLSFEEFFLYQIPVFMRKIKQIQKKGNQHQIDKKIFNSFIDSLPFKLTLAQDRALNAIKADMKSSFSMQRILQGEVASGKTIVAVLSSAIAFDGEYQVAFMVPTEILARQHYESIKPYVLQAASLANRKIKVGLLTSSATQKKKDKIYKDIKQGKVDLIIGTHSLLGENVKFKNLGLVIIDEQHKFGVSQRALLPKKGNNPDCLIMTATPIPRTLSMTIYGDLDISILDILPRGRLPIMTKCYNPDQYREVYHFVAKEVQAGRQAYVVCPTIEESEIMGLRSAKEVYSDITGIFNEFKLDRKINVGLVHGRLKQAQQDKIMRGFKNGLIDVLVATTILEVGIDVANASVMVVEAAQNFGLAQLHQLRGRIGRDKYQSYCLLVADPKGQDARDRIKAITRLSDGFKIAEEDLRIRGPGEFFGRRQHGLSELKIANPLTQMHLLKDARGEASRLLKADPGLCNRQNIELKENLKKRFPEYEELINIG